MGQRFQPRHFEIAGRHGETFGAALAKPSAMLTSTGVPFGKGDVLVLRVCMVELLGGYRSLTGMVMILPWWSTR